MMSVADTPAYPQRPTEQTMERRTRMTPPKLKLSFPSIKNLFHDDSRPEKVILDQTSIKKSFPGRKPTQKRCQKSHFRSNLNQIKDQISIKNRFHFTIRADLKKLFEKSLDQILIMKKFTPKKDVRKVVSSNFN